MLNKKEKKLIKDFSKIEIIILDKKYKVRYRDIHKFMKLNGTPWDSVNDIRNKLFVYNEGKEPKKVYLKGKDPTIAFIDLDDSILASMIYKNKELFYYLSKFKVYEKKINKTTVDKIKENILSLLKTELNKNKKG